jgi:phage-related protein
MATFPSYRPLYSANKATNPKTRTVAFGDGYEQRLSFGLNQRPVEWSLRFDLANTDADAIEAFLNARADDGASFTWTPPESATAGQWVCDSWNRELHEFKRSRIDATFRQVFEP